MTPVTLYGHTGLQLRFREAILRGRLPASLLLHGPRGAGKQRLGLWLGQLMLCESDGERPCGACQSCRFAVRFGHPDLHWYFPRPRLKDADPSSDDVHADYADALTARFDADGLYAPPSGDEAIHLATVHAMVSSAAKSPAMGKRKVYLVGDADRMIPQAGADMAANAFLKLLEEPPADTTIVLTSSEPGALLPTIRSRSVSVRVPSITDDETRALLADPVVQKRVATDHPGVSTRDLVALAGGTPGRLFGQDVWSDAVLQARLLTDAARSADPAAAAKAALVQGGRGARGRFSDTLDALTTLLHEEAKLEIASGREDRARRLSRGVEMVERAKELAFGNVNPQLVTAVLLDDLSPLLR